MKSKLLLALLTALCLFWQASPICAQHSRAAAEAPIAAGRIAGVLTDPSGAVVAGAKVELRNLALGVKDCISSDRQGRFVFDRLSAGSYQLTVHAPGFDIAVISDLSVAASVETVANVALKIAPARTDVQVEDLAIGAGATSPRDIDDADREDSRNAAELVKETPGVSLRENGQLASAPMLHGMGDERAKVVVDGMTVCPACANHMNPPLSYIAPSQAAQVTVLAGITPVSMGGDSIGGTIAVDSRGPVFASRAEAVHEEGEASGFYRSNSQYYGGSLFESVAGRNFGFAYTGSWATNDDYTDGSGHKVTSTYSQSTDHTVTLAAQNARSFVAVAGGLHHIPYQGFVNAQMDMVRNYAESLNLHYRRNFDRGVLDTRVYWQGAWHSMNIGHDKSTFPMPMWMPMNTHGRDLGYSVKLDLPLNDRHTLRVGNELHRFVLDDRWPAVPGTAPYMGPDTFVSINDGRHIRLGSFAEIASRWNPQWSTLFGLRNDTVWTNAGPVQGYSEMMYGADAAAFNALNRAHTDPDLDATALARYEPNANSAYEFGYARKSRAPNLYERYAWSANMMASGMIGWFGDGNYYVGSVGLKPEIANTVSGTASWRGGTIMPWAIKATPYLTYNQGFVDVDTMMTTTYGMSTFAQLQFANHSARIGGADLSGSGRLWNSGSFGQGKLSGVVGWLHGERTDTSTPLYEMMPLNLRVALDEELNGFSAGVGLQAVDRKSKVDPNRLEQTTPGYSLFNLRSSYRHGHLQVSAAADNLLNKAYELPMGGVNFDDFMASGWMSQIKPLTGRGRSFYGSLTARF